MISTLGSEFWTCYAWNTSWTCGVTQLLYPGWGFSHAMSNSCYFYGDSLSSMGIISTRLQNVLIHIMTDLFLISILLFLQLHHHFWLASRKEFSSLWYLCVGRIGEDMADQAIQLEARCLFSEMHACLILLFLFIKLITELIIKTLSCANYWKQLSVTQKLFSSICGKYISSLFKNQDNFFLYIFDSKFSWARKGAPLVEWSWVILRWLG